MNDLTKKMAEALRNISGAIEQIPEDLEGHLWMLDKPLERALETLAAYDAQPEQEPVAWSVTLDGEHCGNFFESLKAAQNFKSDQDAMNPPWSRDIVPLYAAPQETSNE